MKNLYLLVLVCLAIFTSCDSDSDSSTPIITTNAPSSNIDSRLQVYLDEFIIEAGKRGVALNADRLSRLDIQFGVLDSDTLGTCSSSSEKNTITINNNITQSQLRFTVIHELGHCILRIDHRDDVLSIMNSTLREAELANLGDEAAFDELFQERFFEAF